MPCSKGNRSLPISNRIENFIGDLMGIKVEKTIKGETQSSSNKHGELVQSILEKNGFKILNSDSEKSPGLFYIPQPNGSQKFPDFLLMNISKKRNLKGEYKFKTLNFELKRGEKNYIHWNDGFPRRDSLYLYSDTSGYNLLFTGESIGENDRVRYESICSLMEELKSLSRITKGDSTFIFFPRKATKQRVFEGETDWEGVREILKGFMKN